MFAALRVCCSVGRSSVGRAPPPLSPTLSAERRARLSRDDPPRGAEPPFLWRDYEVSSKRYVCREATLDPGVAMDGKDREVVTVEVCLSQCSPPFSPPARDTPHTFQAHWRPIDATRLPIPYSTLHRTNRRV